MTIHRPTQSKRRKLHPLEQGALEEGKGKKRKKITTSSSNSGSSSSGSGSSDSDLDILSDSSEVVRKSRKRRAV